MAEASISEDHFMCSVCLDLLKDPVTVPCGHTYCMRCVTDCWNREDQTGIYSCPQCRQTFSPRPVLRKNVMFAEMMEKLKKTEVRCAVSDHCSAGPADVECDVCTGRKHKAIQSCLLCLNSYCQTHLEQHQNLFRGKRHDLIDATAPLHDVICPRHDKILDIYCRTDQKLICTLCIDEHKNHEKVSSAAAWTEKQVLNLFRNKCFFIVLPWKFTEIYDDLIVQTDSIMQSLCSMFQSQFGERKNQLQQQIQKRQKDLQKIKDAVDSHKVSLEQKISEESQ
ncbi:putative E3 ubiquitin/ISG15 ligase TRIM25 [Triplophysa rosa]|uniref:E3 ubiquitin/ISG15 ligase TRIM25 n=1 Tax=Triplophysa rosa TaxID=992332 RepID=A0A9W7WJZ2_TRIRA|nr:putative E3 ubiquitin/ISG15 ligase TRIM25 [Triplophysa rosa]